MHTVLPSPSAQSGVLYLRKRSRSPGFRLPALSAVLPPWGPHSAKVSWFSPPTPPKPCGPLPPSLPKPRGPLPGMAGTPPGLNPHTRLPLQPHFLLLLQSVTPASIPIFFQLYWAAIVILGRCGPIAWSQSSPSSHAGTVTRGSCLPVTSWVEVTPISLAQSMATAI